MQIKGLIRLSSIGRIGIGLKLLVTNKTNTHIFKASTTQPIHWVDPTSPESSHESSLTRAVLMVSIRRQHYPPALL